jgi:hypothetical protein
MSNARRIVLSADDFQEAEEAPAAASVIAPEHSRPASTQQLSSLPRAGARSRTIVHPPPSSSATAATGAFPLVDRPRVGGWGFAIFFLGLIGGAIGYFVLKGDDPRRADHVLKWGLIVTAISIAGWVLLWVIVLALVASSAPGSALGITASLSSL